ncbi:hypothetical protein XPA_002164 [Xanthoria parietina]
MRVFRVSGTPQLFSPTTAFLSSLRRKRLFQPPNFASTQYGGKLTKLAQKSFHFAVLDLSSAANFQEVAPTAVHLDPLCGRSAAKPVGDERLAPLQRRARHSR